MYIVCHPHTVAHRWAVMPETLMLGGFPAKVWIRNLPRVHTLGRLGQCDLVRASHTVKVLAGSSTGSITL